MATERRGMIVADTSVFGWLPKAAHSVKSWDNSHSPATQKAVYELLREKGYVAESVFDTTHGGRRYMVFLYVDKEGRKACWDTVAGCKG